jgi:hypothetical protein
VTVLTYSKGLAVLRSKAHACFLSIASFVDWPTNIDKVCVSLFCCQAVTPMKRVQHHQVEHVPILQVPHKAVLSSSHLQYARLGCNRELRCATRIHVQWHNYASDMYFTKKSKSCSCYTILLKIKLCTSFTLAKVSFHDSKLSNNSYIFNCNTTG